jgi:hypothetical protein
MLSAPHDAPKELTITGPPAYSWRRQKEYNQSGLCYDSNRRIPYRYLLLNVYNPWIEMKPALPSNTGRSAAPQSMPDRTLLRGRRSAWVQIAATTFFIGFLIIQLIMPIVQLIWAPRPARFGWQMFSVSSPPPNFAVVLDDGTSKPIAIESFVTSLRGDVPLAQFLPPHLCRVVPHIIAVHYQFREASQSETYVCSR